MITHILVVSIPVADQERALGFYRDVLGFGVVRDSPMGPDSRWLQVAPKGASTGIALVTWFDSMAAGSVKGIVFETNDLDKDVADLIAKGVVIEGGIKEEPWGRFVSFDDPDGNGIVLQATSANV